MSIKTYAWPVLACLLSFSFSAVANYSALVIDASSGRVIFANDPAQRWYPASLTKVMTLYLTFAALESGRLKLNDSLPVSKHSARQPNSRIGLRNGQTITVEHAILAVATRSANDAAVVLAEHLGGSESEFAGMMTQQARRLGMHSTSFQNASGLPDEGQISSARDLAILASSLIRDFPQYYPYFSTRQFDYKGYNLPNTNKILKMYPDADGLKTGFTCGSGYNLIASASRNGQRLIGVLLGAHSSAERFQRMGNLLDLGFEKSRVGASGVHVSQLSDQNDLPPPFQLSTHGCAGSARNMGADVDVAVTNNSEKIDIPVGKSSRTVRVVAEKPKPSAKEGTWAALLGVYPSKSLADDQLRKIKLSLGALSRQGKPIAVKQKVKKGFDWQLQWTGLRPSEAKDFCRQLRSKRQECSLLPVDSTFMASAKKTPRMVR